MAAAEVLYSLLVTAAGTAAADARSGDDAEKAAFSALKSHLINNHRAASVSLIELARTNVAYEAAIKSDLARPDIADDPEIKRLARKLYLVIAALPPTVTAPYAIDIAVIEAGHNLLFENVGRVRVDKVTSAADMTYLDIEAPAEKMEGVARTSPPAAASNVYGGFGTAHVG